VSQYDGLNLPELLALMHKPVAPEAVPWLPQTPGWWIVLGWLIAVLFLVAWQLVKRRRRNRYRRDALAELKAIASRRERTSQACMDRTGRASSPSPRAMIRRLRARRLTSRPRPTARMQIRVH
jgi:flagellar biosynthesis/type III secretory pathway M-ring protein FliF/YscJ